MDVLGQLAICHVLQLSWNLWDSLRFLAIVPVTEDSCTVLLLVPDWVQTFGKYANRTNEFLEQAACGSALQPVVVS